MAGLEPSSDPELIERFRSGDREAFAALYRAHQPALFRFAWHMTGDRLKAVEITQDVFVWLIHHSRDFDSRRGALAAFLAGIARKMLLRQRHEGLRWTALDEEALPGEDPSDNLARAQDGATLRKAIAALPLRYREPIVLCDLEGKTYEEAAAQMDCATGTVRSRLHRARALLARKLQWKKEGQGCST